MCFTHAESSHQPPVTRRGVLRAATVGAAAAGGLLAASTAAQAGGSGHHGGSRRISVDRISVQLYTLRDQLAIDLDGTLAALRGIGYRQVEAAGFVGRTAAQFRAALDKAGLRATSGHFGIPQPFDAAAWQATLADARTVGARYVVHPFFGLDFATGQPIRDSAQYRAFARDLNRAGLAAKRAGLQFGYHNHHFEFFRLDGGSRTGWDVLVDETDPDLVHLEMDLFWVTRGAHDPVDLIKANRGRVKQFHVKDFNANGSFEDAGQGLIDFPRIFAHEREAGLAQYIVERDDAGTAPRTPADSISTARVGFDYLASVRF